MFNMSSMEMEEIGNRFMKIREEKHQKLLSYIDYNFDSKKASLLRILNKHGQLSDHDFSYIDLSPEMKTSLEEESFSITDFSMMCRSLVEKLNDYSIDYENPVSEGEECLFYFSWFIFDGIKSHDLIGQGAITTLSLPTVDDNILFNSGNELLNRYFNSLSVGDQVTYKTTFNSLFDFIGEFKNGHKYQVTSINPELKIFEIHDVESDQKTVVDVTQVYI